jgi:ATP-dependent Clp protease ATP-binding subunit ClpA
MDSERVPLDITARCEEAVEFEEQMKQRVIGQPEAIAKTVELVQTHSAGLGDADHPAGVLLMLGPTGTGKTHLAETVAEVLLGSRKALYKLNCADYQDSYQTNRLLGPPPGYLGYDKDKATPLLTQEILDKYQTKEMKLNVMLIDEIEKADETLYQSLLSVFDKAELVQSNGTRIDFTKTFIFVTSNLGAKKLDHNTTGFMKQEESIERMDRAMDVSIKRAVEKKFTPEFVNRFDKSVIFHTLSMKDMRQILELQLLAVRRRIITSKDHRKFTFRLTQKAKDYFLEKGYDKKYNARPLKRLIETSVVNPLSNLLMTNQLDLGDMVIIDYKRNKLVYDKVPGAVVLHLPEDPPDPAPLAFSASA